MVKNSTPVSVPFLTILVVDAVTMMMLVGWCDFGVLYLRNFYHSMAVIDMVLFKWLEIVCN